jgi:hypothetical protein
MKNYKRQVVAQTVIKTLKGYGKFGGKRRIKKKRKKRRKRDLKKGNSSIFSIPFEKNGTRLTRFLLNSVPHLCLYVILLRNIYS